MNLKLEFTRDLPDKVGYYWYCDFGEHTPCILEVSKSEGKWWANGEEINFQIKKRNRNTIIKECEELGLEPVDGFYHGEELWCYVPCPLLPNGTPTTPGCY